MKKMIVIMALLTGCAHHRDVRPNDSGIHTVVFQTESKTEGYNNAMSQAKHYCETQNKNAYVVKEDHKYVGDMKESDYKTAKTTTKVAKGLGGAGMVFGGKKEANAGGVLGLGGVVADGALGNAYTYTLQFTCK